jgi:hypothetical protein
MLARVCLLLAAIACAAAAPQAPALSFTPYYPFEVMSRELDAIQR